MDFGPPLHSLALICKDAPLPSSNGNNTVFTSVSTSGDDSGEHEEGIVGLHPIEEDYLSFYSIKNNQSTIKYLPKISSSTDSDSDDQEHNGE